MLFVDIHPAFSGGLSGHPPTCHTHPLQALSGSPSSPILYECLYACGCVCVNTFVYVRVHTECDVGDNIQHSFTLFSESECSGWNENVSR